MAELVLHNGEIAVLRTPLHGQTVTVGRSVVNDISIPDDVLPPFLCAFEPLPSGAYRVIDKSGQGVLMGTSRVQDTTVPDGASFRFGKLRASFRSGGELKTRHGLDAEQRTGILKTRGDGKLVRSDIRLRLHNGTRLEIPASGLRVGALPDNDVVIDDGFVSSFHAQLFLRGERLFVRDLDSTNGTFVGDVRVVEAEVPLGSMLRFGKVTATVDVDEKPIDLEAASPTKGKGPWRCAELTTADARFAKTFTLIEKVAPHDATACIFGETGTGKELVAHALHTLSGRRGGPMVPLNCASFPEDLIESELFGHEKGAFTGADRQRKGAFEEADKGTLFLDEIGELPLEMQAKLLRVLETRKVRRLGGRGDIAIDVRIVCATHRDLVQHVRDGRFREDLLHRIYVIPVKLPSLRERSADVVHLARYFAQHLSPTSPVAITPAAEEKLTAHPFPGNVRELRNVIQRAIIMGDGKTIDHDDVDFIPLTLEEQKDGAAIYRKGMTMEDVERAAIEAAIAAHTSLSEAAKTPLWRKATAFGLVDKAEKEERE